MSNLIAANCCCGMMNGETPLDLSTTVPAGGVSGGLGVCGIPAMMTRLPVTYIRPQDYSEGYCPADALEVGTMFPELVSVYK